MQIVVTDGHALNPGDLSWKKIEELGSLTIFDRTPADKVVERCSDAEIILTNKTPINSETISRLSQLRMISVLATGYNIVDIVAARDKGIVVCNVPAYGTASVAQHVFALLLELTNHVGLHSQSTAAGEWQKAKDWSYTILPLTELSGKTLGIIGLGNIGQQVARIGINFGMDVIYFNPRPKTFDYARQVTMEEVFEKSDVLTLHCPVTPDNTGFVNKDLLSKMKKSSILINTARGQLINEADLANALNNGIISAAALDVLSKEPPVSDNPLLTAKNCILTPHNAWMSREARERIIGVTARNIIGFIQGQVINRVN